MLDFIMSFFGPTFQPPEELHPVLGPAVKRAREGEAGPLRAIFADTSNDVNLRHAAVDACARSYLVDQPTASSSYDAWVISMPNDAFARLARATYHLDRIPGYNPDDPDRDALIAEGDRRRAIAAEDLAVAERVAPHDPVVHGFLFRVPKPHERDHSRYAELAAHAGPYTDLHRSMFWTKTQRWGGAPNDGLSFARQLASQFGGTELPLFIVYAYWERHWYLENMSRKPDEARAIVADPNVQAECLAAYEATLGSPQHVTTTETWWFRQLAARWFDLVWQETGDSSYRERARVELRRLGTVFVPYETHFWCMSAKEFTKARRALRV